MIENSETLFDRTRFEQLRAARGISLGTPLHLFESVGSTNDEAKRAARAGAPGGALFLTEHQSQGRGRREHTWSSPPRENLLFSLVLRPDIAPSMASPLALVAGLAVREGLAALGVVNAQIKWPNDILVGRRKLAGILIESQLQGASLAAVVLGIGINVNARAFDPELSSQATSLRLLRGATFEREFVLVAVLEALEARVEQYQSAGLAPMLDELQSFDALRGELVTVDGVRGKGCGLDASGALLIDAGGRVERVLAGSVLWEA